MLRNYFKVALRNLSKNKFISFINLFGLTVGLTCCFLILLYILNELSFDRYNANADRIYRVTRTFNSSSGEQMLHLGTIAPPFAPLIRNDFPDIEKVTCLYPDGLTEMKYEDKIFNETGAFYADEYLFDVFSVDVLRGNQANALTEPYSVMMTEEIAKKYFGNEDPMNKVVRIYDLVDFKVTGIFKPFPSNAHLHPNILLSFNSLKDSTIYGEESLRTNYGNNSFLTYLLLPENYPIDKIAAQLPDFINRHMPASKSNPGTAMSNFTALHLQKLTDIHLRSHLDYEVEENGDIKRVYIFSAIALFILLIACINYMNLSTARSALRAREIGVRKVMGALRKELILQFLSECILISMIALVISLIATWLFLPLLNQVSGQQLAITSLMKWQLLVPLLLIPFIVGIFSGIYPALFLSSFQPVTVLKGMFKAGTNTISFRKVLVITQFSISIILIISTAVVFLQLRYMQNKSLGFNRENIITIPFPLALQPQWDAFRSDLMQNPTIKNVARSSRIPTGRLLDAMDAYTYNGDSAEPVSSSIKFVTADEEFIPTYGVPIAAGRNFSRDYSSDSANFILNEASARMLGMKSPQEAIGKDFRYGQTRGKVIGVMGDFHFESMHQKIVPLVLTRPGNFQPYFGNISVKISGGNISGALNQVEKTWKKFLPETPYQYTFMDENFARLYEAEQRQGTIFSIFSGIAIFIACLGLFGLSAFTISQRIKEIGIRKVLGATVTNIVSMLSKDFLRLVLIAALISFPIAWFAMNKWLEDFAYRIQIGWWIFPLAAFIALLIALGTISFQAVKAAIANPVGSLRSE